MIQLANAILSLTLCLADGTECMEHDFEPAQPMTVAQCQATVLMATAQIMSQMGEGLVLKSFRCRVPGMDI